MYCLGVLPEHLNFKKLRTSQKYHLLVVLKKRDTVQSTPD